MKTVACLTGSGTAPELMAEAMYALDAVARVHGFAFDQVHAPFGGVALARLGQAAETRCSPSIISEGPRIAPHRTAPATRGASAALSAVSRSPRSPSARRRGRAASRPIPAPRYSSAASVRGPLSASSILEKGALPPNSTAAPSAMPAPRACAGSMRRRPDTPSL